MSSPIVARAVRSGGDGSVVTDSKTEPVAGRHRDDDRIPSWLVWAAFAVYGACSLTIWAEPEWRLDWDSAVYLLTGHSIAAGAGYQYLGEPFFLRPPGLAWLLSLLIRPVGNSPDFAFLNRLFMLTETATVIAVYATFRAQYGRGWALAIALLTGTSPIFVDQFDFILSDVPFLALLLPALTLLERGAHGGRRASAYAVVGALLLVLAIHLRSVGIIALPALAVIHLRHRGWRQRLADLLPIVVICALSAPWFIYAQSAANEAERPAEQLYLFDYTTALLHRDPGDPDSPFLTSSEWTGRLERNAEDIASELAGSVLGSTHPAAIALLLALMATGLTAAIHRGARLLDWFALAYAAVLLGYFTFSPRLLLPLLPIVYAYLAEAIMSLTRRISKPRGATIGFARSIAAVVVGTVALNNAIAFPNRLDVRGRSAITDRRWKDMTTASAWLQNNTSEAAVVLAAMAPIVSVLSHRITYTGRHMRRPGAVERHGIDYAIAFPWTPKAVRGSMEERSTESWKISSATPGKWTHIYRIDH